MAAAGRRLDITSRLSEVTGGDEVISASVHFSFERFSASGVLIPESGSVTLDFNFDDIPHEVIVRVNKPLAVDIALADKTRAELKDLLSRASCSIRDILGKHKLLIDLRVRGVDKTIKFTTLFKGDVEPITTLADRRAAVPVSELSWAADERDNGPMGGPPVNDLGMTPDTAARTATVVASLPREVSLRTIRNGDNTGLSQPLLGAGDADSAEAAVVTVAVSAPSGAATPVRARAAGARSGEVVLQLGPAEQKTYSAGGPSLRTRPRTRSVNEVYPPTYPEANPDNAGQSGSAGASLDGGSVNGSITAEDTQVLSLDEQRKKSAIKNARKLHSGIPPMLILTALIAVTAMAMGLTIGAYRDENPEEQRRLAVASSILATPLAPLMAFAFLMFNRLSELISRPPLTRPAYGGLLLTNGALAIADYVKIGHHPAPIPAASPSATPSVKPQTPTETPTPNSLTPTSTAKPTNTPAQTVTATRTRSASETPTPTDTSTRSASETPTPTDTSTRSATETPTPTDTSTRSATETPTPTDTSTRSATETPPQPPNHLLRQ